MTLIDKLNQFTDDILRDEIYGGTSILDVLDMVDLDVGFGMDDQGRPTTLSVVEQSCAVSYEHEVPEVIHVELNNGKYMIRRKNDFDYISEDVCKIMRARFLLLNKYYYRHLRRMSESMRQLVIARFFGGSVWMPAEGSGLSQMMGLE